MSQVKSAWIQSRAFDCAFILAPPFLITALVLLVPGFSREAAAVPLWAWVVFIMGIDVAHVYSTLYRTYLDKEEVNSRPILYTMTPLICWFLGVVLYSFGSQIFWRVLAYIAVFHFIRQQYGFMMLYLRKGEKVPNFCLSIDKITIYAATIYPLIFWHTHPREFSWFVSGDFIYSSSDLLKQISWLVYISLLAAYFLKELWLLTKRVHFNLPKNLLLLGTIISWYVGIVLLNGDLAFTLTNVVSHGIPYIALIWIYGRRKWAKVNPQKAPWVAKAFSIKAIPIFILALILLAYLEEGVWDLFVWGEHGRIFFGRIGAFQFKDTSTLTWLIPLLTVPQLTHYVLDGFIWKLKKPDQTMQGIVASEAI